MGGGCCCSCYVSKPSFSAAKNPGLGLGRSEEKFADSDANSESVTTLGLILLVIIIKEDHWVTQEYIVED